MFFNVEASLIIASVRKMHLMALWNSAMLAVPSKLMNIKRKLSFSWQMQFLALLWSDSPPDIAITPWLSLGNKASASIDA
jgi:hypothetical protein